MEKKEAIFKSALQPAPKVLVSCRDHAGRDNALAVGYCGNCSYDPPMVMVGIVPSRYSYHMIKETGCFVVNLVEKGMEKQFEYLGNVSGREADKLKEMGMEVAEGTKVSAPLLVDCPVNIECTVVDSIVTGSHEMFVGRIEAVHARGDLVDGGGKIDFAALDLL